jgi:hypothetical protein
MISVDKAKKYGFKADKHLGLIGHLNTIDLHFFIRQEKPGKIHVYCNTFNRLITLPKSKVLEMLGETPVTKKYQIAWNETNTIEIYPAEYYLTKEVGV